MTIELTPTQCESVISIYCTRDELVRLPEPSHSMEMGDIDKLVRLEFPAMTPAFVGSMTRQAWWAGRTVKNFNI